VIDCWKRLNYKRFRQLNFSAPASVYRVDGKFSGEDESMFARIFSGGLVGIDACRIEVEVDVGGGLGQIFLVGLPDTAVKESQERVRAAIKSCQFLMPAGKKWVVNLAPADMKKEGPSYDLPIAIGVLAATGLIPREDLNKLWFLGELSLDGSVRPVAGVLPIAVAARQHGAEGIVVPDVNAEEASLVDGLKVYPVSHLKQVCDLARDRSAATVLKFEAREAYERLQRRLRLEIDFRDVKGQVHAKRALEIAAAGHHNVLMVGPPGSGKSMLAQRLPTIMPPLSFDEALEVTKLYSVAGLLADRKSLMSERPFRSPHHTASAVGLTGGGSVPRPGEISLSHKGILFLDELTEFPRSHLDTLRQPLESRLITISRAAQTLTYPASFLLIGACNPCPCGYRGDQVKYCACTPNQADRYWSRLSGPFLDRVDLHVEVSRLAEEELSASAESESSEVIRLRVERAVERQHARAADQGRFTYNGHMNQKQLAKFCKIDEQSRSILARAVNQLGLSARAYDRVLRIARTIADLADRDQLIAADIAEAVRYRTIQRAA
jgi:magnesium chelatase family protein